MWLNEIFLAILFLCLPLLLGFIRNWVGAVLVSLIFLGIYSAIYWFLNTAEFAKKQEMEYQQEQSISMAIEEYKKNKLDSIENLLSFKNPDESPDRISELAFIQIEQEYPNRKIEKTLKVERPDLFNDRELSLFGKVQNFKFSLFIIVIILVTILSTLLAYTIEYYIRSQNNSTNESFVDGRLFFKYGEYIDSSIIPIGVKESHPNYSDIGGLINKLYEEISIDLDNKFTGDEFYFKDELMVSDAGRKKDSRRFIRLTFTTIRNTSLTCLISVSKIGKQITIKNFHFIRYRIRWTGVLTFIVTAPIHYWFWIFHWIRGNASIESTLGTNFYNNAFDSMDIEAYLKASNFSIMWSIEDFAKNNQLYTDELKQLITNNITNTQNVTIKKSRGVNIGKMKLSSSQVNKA